LDRLRARRIFQKKVLAVLKNPDEEKLSYKGRKIVRKKFKEKIMEVVIKKEGSKTLIITAYYLWK